MKCQQSTLNPLQQSLALKLCYLPCFHQLKVDNITAIDAGLSQPCFYVIYKSKTYFAKYLDVNSIEALASQQAANYGISPQLIYVGHNWLITDFIAGEGLDTTNKSEDQKLTIMLALLTRCHRITDDVTYYKPKGESEQSSSTQKQSATGEKYTIKFFIPNLDIFSTIEQLLLNVACSSNLECSLLSLVGTLKQNFISTTKMVPNIKQVFCHGDANFSNVIQQETTSETTKSLYQLIDFECACIAPIEFDIAMLMAVNEIQSSKVELINSLYLQSQNILIEPEKSSGIVDNLLVNESGRADLSKPLVTCYLNLSYLINSLWYLSKYQSSKQKKYKILAEKQLLLLAISHPQAGNVLEQMR